MGFQSYPVPGATELWVFAERVLRVPQFPNPCLGSVFNDTSARSLLTNMCHVLTVCLRVSHAFHTPMRQITHETEGFVLIERKRNLFEVNFLKLKKKRGGGGTERKRRTKEILIVACGAELTGKCFGILDLFRP